MTSATTVDQKTGQEVLGGKNDLSTLNTLLRGELSAVETYNQALGKFVGNDSEVAVKALRRLRDEHQSTVHTLQTRVLALGGTPDEGSGAWGVFTAAVTGTAKVLGPHTTIAALRQGEEHGVNDYKEAIQKDDVSPECKYLLRNEQTRCTGHIETLDRLVADLNQSGK